MSDFDEMDYVMAKDSRSRVDCDERFEELYEEAKAGFKADSQSHRFDELFSLEHALQKKTVWGFKAAKRLLKNALVQPTLEAITARFRQLLPYANAVTSNDFDGCVIKVVNRLASLSKTEILRALFSISAADVPFTNAGARTAIKIAQAIVRLQPNASTLGCLSDLQHCLESVKDISTMTKNQCLLELYVLELELFLRTERFENMDVVYCKAISMEDRVLGSQHVSAAHGYYGRYLLRCDRAPNALEYLVKAVKDETSIADKHHTACVQSLALVAYTSADTSAHELLHRHSGRRDVAAIRRFAMAFLREEVDGLELVLEENDDTFEDREICRLLRRYETVLKRKRCLRTSPLPVESWADILPCLTHPIWHDLHMLCRKFDPVLAPLLHHLHSDVQKACFLRIAIDGALHWEVTLHSRSHRTAKEVSCYHVLGDELLASAAMQDVVVVEICFANEVTDDGIVRFCFGRDGRQFEIRQPKISRNLFSRLVEEHSAATNDHEFTLTVAYPSHARSAIRRQITAAYLEYRVEQTDLTSSYEIPSGSTLLNVHIAYSMRDRDTMTVLRKRRIM
ncbi:Cop9 signalosome complex subunit [Aphelenchoides avenae]|nr:Cop9 signalosome complex subunit [Aphelenchus avenae]